MIAYVATLHGSSAAALVPLIVLAVAFEVFCLFDVFHTEKVRSLPRWAWAIICLISIPLGGIIYLVAGRQR
jgi:Phospholipase_D-nuclease N-terminal